MEIFTDTTAQEEQLLERAAKLYGMTTEEYVELVLRQHLQRLVQMGRDAQTTHS